MGGVLLGVLVAVLGAPDMDGRAGGASEPDLKLAEPWCEGKQGAEVEACLHLCGRRPVHPVCDLIGRFGLPGMLVGAVARKRGVPVTVAATAFGLSDADGQLLAVLYDLLGVAPLPLDPAQAAQVANADRHLEQGTFDYTRGRYRECAEASGQAATLYGASVGELYHKVLTARRYRGLCLMLAGQYEAAEVLKARGLRDAERLYGPHHPQLATALIDLGVLYRAMGADAEAKALYQRALAIQKRALGVDHPYVASTLNNLADLYWTMEAFTLAKSLLLRALAIQQKALGPDHPDVAIVLNNLAALCQAMGEYTEAEPHLQHALAIQQKTLGPNHPHVASTLNNLGLLYHVMGAYAEAEPRYRRALDIIEEALGPDHPHVAATLNNLGHLAAAMSDITAAAGYMHRAVAIRAAALPPHHPDRAASAQTLGLYLLRLGQPAQARPLLEEAERGAHTHFQTTADIAHTDADLFALHQRQRFNFATATGIYGPEDGFGAALRWQGGGLTAEMLWRDLRRVEHAERQQAGHVRRVEAFRQAAAQHLRLLRAFPEGPEQRTAYEARLAAARVAMDDAEAALIEDHPQLAERRKLPGVQPPDVCRALHARGKLPLLDYVHYQRVDPEAESVEHIPHLLAFVVEPIAAGEDGEPTCHYHRVDLGPSKPLTEAYSDWREAVGEAEACFGRHGRPQDCETVFAAMDYNGTALRALAWDPVVAEESGVPWLANQGRILIVPDGPLTGVPLGALPTSTGRYLVEDHEFTVLSFPAAVTLPEPSLPDLRERDRGALVVGDINYEWGLAPSVAGQYVRRCHAKGCQKVGSEDKQGIDTALDRRSEQTEVETPGFDPLSGAECGPEHAAWSKLVSRSHTESRNDDSQRWPNPLTPWAQGAEPVARPRAEAMPGIGEHRERRHRRRGQAIGDQRMRAPLSEESEVSRLDRLAMDMGRALGEPSELIAGQMASEYLVTARMPDRPIIHLQTHGYSITDQACAERHARIKPRKLPGALSAFAGFEADETVFDPHRLSGLIFAARNTHAADQNTKRELDSAWRPEPEEARNDGLLLARDVLNLNLRRTWLVVLAACQTGLGQQFDGEGVLGLGRAFLVAGARYAVVSQWQVPFHATSRMFTAFYGHVVAGVAPPTALRKAQVAVITELRKSGVRHSAFFWGAFSPLVGYGESDGGGRPR